MAVRSQAGFEGELGEKRHHQLPPRPVSRCLAPGRFYCPGNTGTYLIGQRTTKPVAFGRDRSMYWCQAAKMRRPGTRLPDKHKLRCDSLTPAKRANLRCFMRLLSFFRESMSFITNLSPRTFAKGELAGDEQRSLGKTGRVLPPDAAAYCAGRDDPRTP